MAWRLPIMVVPIWTGALMGKNKRQGGLQQGPARHSPTQQGPKTRARQAEIAHTPTERNERNESSRSKRKS